MEWLRPEGEVTNGCPSGVKLTVVLRESEGVVCEESGDCAARC